MNLLQNLGLPILHWNESVKVVKEQDSQSNHIKQVMLKDNEVVYLIEVKSFSEIATDNFFSLLSLAKEEKRNFLKLKYVIMNDEMRIFFAYERSASNLTEYLCKNELSIEKRFFIFKQVIEVVSSLIKLTYEKFLEFDQTLFFIQEDEKSQQPLLKFIYHGGLINKQKTNELPSCNFYYWLFYLHFLIFKDYSNNNESNELSTTFINSGIFQEDLKFLSNLLTELITGKMNMLPFDVFVEIYNKILKKAKFNEIDLIISNHNQPNNNHINNNNFYNNRNFNQNPLNMNLFAQNNNPPFNPMMMNFNHPQNININNNINNSHINYNQFFQIFNNGMNNLQNDFNYPNFNFEIPKDKNLIRNFNHLDKMKFPQNLNFLNSPEIKSHSNFNPVNNNFYMNQNNFNPYIHNTGKTLHPYNNIPYTPIVNNMNTIEPLKMNYHFNLNNLNNIRNNLTPLNENFLNDLNNKKPIYQFEDKSKKSLSFDNMFNDYNENKANLLQNKIPLIKNNKIKNILQKQNNSAIYNFITDSETGKPSITITIEKKILNEFSPKTFCKSDSASVCSAEEKEKVLKKKRNCDESLNLNESEHSIKKNSSQKKKLRTTNKTKSCVEFYDWDLPQRTTLTYNDLNENELEMINKIDYPRRKKIKEKFANDDKGCFSGEKSHVLKTEVNNFSPCFDGELENSLKCKAHIFMKNHFPLMYNLENFYMYVFKLNKVRSEYKQCIRFEKDKTCMKIVEEINEERKVEEDIVKINQNLEINSSNNIIEDKKENENLSENNIKMNNEQINVDLVVEDRFAILKNIIDCKNPHNVCRKIWNPRLKDSLEIDNFLQNLETIWPIEKFFFLQESSLEFLSNNEYELELTYEKVKTQSLDFLQFLKDKKLSREEMKNNVDLIYTKSNKASKRIHFNKLKNKDNLL